MNSHRWQPVVEEKTAPTLQAVWWRRCSLPSAPRVFEPAIAGPLLVLPSSSVAERLQDSKHVTNTLGPRAGNASASQPQPHNSRR